MESFDVKIIRKGVEEKASRQVSEEVPLTIDVNGE